MFTGIIQGLGRIVMLNKKANELHLAIEALFNFSKPEQGESVAINGVCLTLESYTNVATFYASEQTVSKTTLSQVKIGDLVNMERALSLNSRLGGHLISGHVDAMATVQKIETKGQSKRYTLHFPEFLQAEILNNGSVALDGISLTVIDLESDHLTVNLIPESQKQTNVQFWQVGTKVNVETDLLGKYVAKQLSLMNISKTKIAQNRDKEQNKGNNKNAITAEFLLECGFSSNKYL